jgi:hypothetical protein
VSNPAEVFILLKCSGAMRFELRMSHVTQKSTQKHLRIPPLVSNFEAGSRKKTSTVNIVNFGNRGRRREQYIDALEFILEKENSSCVKELGCQ